MEFDSPNEFKYHMIEMLIILIGSFILLGQYEYLFNNERYYKEYELINVVNDDSAGRKMKLHMHILIKMMRYISGTKMKIMSW